MIKKTLPFAHAEETRIIQPKIIPVVGDNHQDTNRRGAVIKPRMPANIDKLSCSTRNYDKVKTGINNFDLFMMFEYVPSSTLISAANTRQNGCAVFSHCGLLLTGHFLQQYMGDIGLSGKQLVSNIDAKEIYVFESVMSGRLNDKVFNIYGEAFFGCQIRPLREQLQQNENNEPGASSKQFAWCPLRTSLQRKCRDDTIASAIKQFLGRGSLWQDTKISTDSSSNVLPFLCMQCSSDSTLSNNNNNGELFCAEMCTECFKYISLLAKTTYSAHMIPIDFLGADQDIPKMTRRIIYLTLQNIIVEKKKHFNNTGNSSYNNL